MKKQVSTLSLIALTALSIWQYFTEHKKDTKPTPTTTQQQNQSAVDFIQVFIFSIKFESIKQWLPHHPPNLMGQAPLQAKYQSD